MKLRILIKIFMEEDKYKIIFFKKSNNRSPAIDYIEKLPEKDQIKIFDFISSLSLYVEFRKEPISRHLMGKLRELKVDFSNNRYRVIYFFRIGKRIVILRAFSKKTSKTPNQEINKAMNYMQEYLNNIKN
jgi:phage-related protein